MASERSPKRQPDDGRRAQLIEAATRVIAREGVAAATTRRIAAEAGVPHGLVHYWFTGKDELLDEVVQGMLRQLEAATAEPAGRPELDAAEDFAQRFRSAFELIEGDDRGRQIALFELTTWSLRSTEYRGVARAQYAAYRATAESVTGPWLADHGVELPASPQVFAQFVSALFDGVNLAWLADPDGISPQEIFDFVGAVLARYAQVSKIPAHAESR
jgi:AcrR family transcriptional regulator